MWPRNDTLIISLSASSWVYSRTVIALGEMTESGKTTFLELLVERDVIGVPDDFTLWVVILKNA